MHFAQHAILSWFTAEAAGVEDLADRRAVTLCGVLPDIDVLPYAGAILWNWATGSDGFRPAMQRAFEMVHIPIHHVVTHGLFFVCLTGVAVWLWKRRRLASMQHGRGASSAGNVALLCMATTMLHCLCDVIASGPTWPIYPFWPLSSFAWGYPWSWTLADWPNILVLAACLVAMRQYAVYRRRSVLETVNVTLDQHFVCLVRGECRVGK